MHGCRGDDAERGEGTDRGRGGATMTVRRVRLAIAAALVVVAIVVLHAVTAATAVRAQEALPGRVEPVEAKLEQRTGLALTIYNNDLALVRDRRHVSLREGLNILRLPGMATGIELSSVRLGPSGASGGFAVVEHSLEYDLADRQRLLAKYVGRMVEFDCDGAIRPARLLAVDAQGRLTVEMDGKILLDPPGRLQLPMPPEGISASPTLVCRVQAGAAQEVALEVDYLTRGVSWRADYVCVLDERDATASLTARATIRNDSGATYPDASLRLVAGEVRVSQTDSFLKAGAAVGATRLAAAAEPPEEQQAFEYHTYALPGLTTLADGGSKLVELFSARAVPVRKVYEFLSSAREYGYETSTGRKERGRVRVIIELQNKAESGLGIALPAGTVRLYKAVPPAGLDFLGEDEIRDTARGETVRMYVGDAFDIVGERITTDYKRTGSDSFEEACCIRLSNQKSEDVEVVVIERFYGEWTISSPTPFQKLDANTAAFRVKVPKGGEAEVLYRVRVIGD